MDNQPKPLRRLQAAALIRAEFSIPCSERTLAKYASKGGGPLYRYSGRFPVYDVADLMAWGAGKVGPKVETFSEAREASAA